MDPLSRTEKYLFHKTDFCFCYSHLHPKYAALYHRLQNATISHTSDESTQAASLFSGIEVKPPNDGAVEAQVQVSSWLAASLRKKADLASTEDLPSGSYPLRSQSPHTPLCVPISR
ncbi:uncharacterized protein RCC_04668 [Ramularia collo-cygni]|uniref:PD-(D/E)XK nuclease-like domain-containing protein n=1 Tax=Ramularia collo-cygni TaxID=112498 RepID=A0A2D3V8B9_9PEZI|nr:uncharacterized protein RCC_04668 [Ramularia collo-cygni]CZT18824.1 uncharacterized protein RCC_04668 [Ramularia collo-cygni]